jgi:hypothetical protein
MVKRAPERMIWIAAKAATKRSAVSGHALRWVCLYYGRAPKPLPLTSLEWSQGRVLWTFP